MASHSGTFDPQTVDLLRGVVDDIWASLSDKQRAAFPKDEIARLVMLLAEAGVMEPDELREAALRSLVSGSEA